MFQVYFIRTRFNEFLNGKSYVNDVGNNRGYNIDVSGKIYHRRALNTNKMGTLMFLLNEHWTFRSKQSPCLSLNETLWPCIYLCLFMVRCLCASHVCILQTKRARSIIPRAISNFAHRIEIHSLENKKKTIWK